MIALPLLLALAPAGRPAARPPAGSGELVATPLALSAGPAADPGGGAGDAGACHPRLARGADGVLRMTWSRRDGDVARVLVAPLSEGTFGAGVELARGSALFVNWADAAVADADGAGRVRGAWLEALPSGPHAYGARLGAPAGADGDADAGAPAWLHDDRSAAEHGFVSIAPRADGLDLVWLDGRATAGAHGDGAGATALYLRSVDGAAAGTAPGPELVLDPRVCDCCQTALARLADGTLVCAYRDRGPAEERDVSFVRVAAGAASAPAPVHADGWRIDGCPVNGPAVAARGDRVACAWYTEAPSPRVLLALSTPGARAFEPPLRVDSEGAGATKGRVDVAWLADGSLLVAYLARVEDRGVWRVRRVEGGALGPELDLATVDPGRASGFLRLAAGGDGAIAAWTRSAPATGLAAARIAVAR